MSLFLKSDGGARRATSIWIKVLTAIGIILVLERVVFYQRQWSAHIPAHNKAIIVASIQKEDARWLTRHFAQDWDVKIYVADSDKADYTVLKNAGKEASVYLSYIINNYWSLPEYMLFSHAQRYQWHNDDPMFDGVVPIQNIRLNHVHRVGYTNLRCTQSPGCPASVHPNSTKDDANIADIDRVFADFYKELFPGDKRVPEAVGHPCCGQFAVTREQVHKRTITDYERLRHWLWTSDLTQFQMGRIFEHAWHIIFDKPAVHCPSAPECYCKLYGLCDLKCPDAPASCLGRFQKTPFFVRINDQWPMKGQGEKGFPVDRWWEEYYPTDVYDGFRLRKNATLPDDAYRAKPTPRKTHERNFISP